MWLLWYPAASSEGTLKSFQARRHAYACSMFWVCSGVSSPQQIHTAVPEAGPLFSSKRDKEANSSCYLIFPTADKDWNLNWLMSEIHHLWWRCPAAEPYTGSGKSVREDKWQKRKSKLSSPDWITLRSSLRIHTFLEQHTANQPGKKRKTVAAAPGVNMKIW